MGRLAGSDRVVRAGWWRDSPRLRLPLPHTKTLTPAMLLAASVLSLSGAARGEGAWGRSCADAFESGAYEVAQAACREAAERGSADASFHLALLYAEGRGVRRDYALAVRWLREAAVQGHQEAAYNLGVAYQFANGIESDNAQAAAWYRQAAESGLAKAQRNLAHLLRQGNGVAQDPVRARYWYSQAASQNEPESQLQLGLMFLSGEGGAQDGEEARRWLEKSAQAGYANGQLSLAMLLADTEPATSLRWYQQAASQGHPYAQHHLAAHYLDNGTGRADLERALTLATAAMDGGHARSADLVEAISKKLEQTTAATPRPEPAKSHKPGKPLAPPVSASLAEPAVPESASPRAAASPPAAVSSAWLMAQPGEAFTIQLAVASRQEGIEALVRRHDLASQAHYYATLRPSQGGQAPVFVLVHGRYASQQEAQRALEALPDAVRAGGAWVRRFSALQKSYRAPN